MTKTEYNAFMHRAEHAIQKSLAGYVGRPLTSAVQKFIQHNANRIVQEAMPRNLSFHVLCDFKGYSVKVHLVPDDEHTEKVFREALLSNE